jgi:DNA polymerase-3 subunit delta'
MVTFEDILGREQIKEHLQTAIAQKKVSHAYIFQGEQGTGKRLLADVFASTLQCEEGGINPCGACKSCIQAQSGNHPDIIWVSHKKQSVSVDDIREQVNNDMGIKPYSGRWKIYIISDADTMGTEAQNALLKTIEEPPTYGMVILLVENINHLLPTILSRCVVLNLKPVEEEKIVAYLIEKYQISEREAKLAAQFSQGNIGKAARYGTSGDFDNIREDSLHLLKYIDEMKISEIIEAVRRLSEYKNRINDSLDFMQLWYRDILLYKVTREPDKLLFKEELHFITEQANKRSYEGLENIIKAMDKAKIRLAANANFDITMELMLLTIKECEND